MKKILRIAIPVILAIAIVACTAWYLFSYDREFTRDMLLTCARYSESEGNHKIATWFYNRAYAQASNNDEVAIELANQYKKSGNYTKAEYTLSHAIGDGGGIDLYLALCNVYLEQDKIQDAVNMLNNISNTEIKAQLDAMRPEAPTASPQPGFYNLYISATLEGEGGTIYANPTGEYPSTNGKYESPIALGDGETNIYAVTIAENGLVSPLAIFPYTIGGVIEKMNFADPAIEAAVRTILEVSETKDLYTNDLWKIKEFTVPADAKSYEDLKHMIYIEQLTVENGVAEQLGSIAGHSKLERLTVTGTQVSQDELKIIAALPSLKELTLKDAGLSGIAPLKDATGLTKLDISKNPVRAIDAISNMKALTELNMSGNSVNDLSALSGITTLQKLDISSNQLTSLAPISSLTALVTLDASVNQITELGEIGNLTALSELSLEKNKLTNIGSLYKCTGLTKLNIASNELTDITSLSTLVKINHFDFSYNQVTALPAFSSDCALITISGSNNKVSSLSQLSGLQQLNTVNMDYNEGISSVSALANCPVLTRVNVYGTKVSEVRVLTDQSIEVNYNPVQ